MLKKWKLKKENIIFDSHAYADRKTKFSGHNFVGYNSFLSECNIGLGSYIADFSVLYHTSVGKYTSVGSGVMTAVGHHPIDECVTTCPSFFSKNPPNGISYRYTEYQERKLVGDGKYSITIGSDVWIGSHVTLLEGICVGDGAIVGAGSVVTRDIESYGVYCGNPARLVRWRFQEEKKKELQKLQWWNKEEKWIQDNISMFQMKRESDESDNDNDKDKDKDGIS